jgi:hypothetical protein
MTPALSTRLAGCCGLRNAGDLVTGGRGRLDQAIDSMHLSMHGEGRASVGLPIIAWAIVIVTRSENFAPLYEHCTQVEIHGALQGCSRALREIEVRLAHYVR